jgi:exonuclease III
MVDVFRSIHGYGDIDSMDISYPTGNTDTLTGRRIDHILASTNLNPRSCHYDVDGLVCSDHTPMIAEFGPKF